MAGSKDYVRLVPRNQTQHEGVIKTLENMLEVAKREGLTGVAVVGVDAAGFTHSAYEPGENIHTMIGALARMQHRLLNN